MFHHIMHNNPAQLSCAASRSVIIVELKFLGRYMVLQLTSSALTLPWMTRFAASGLISSGSCFLCRADRSLSRYAPNHRGFSTATSLLSKKTPRSTSRASGCCRVWYTGGTHREKCIMFNEFRGRAADRRVNMYLRSFVLER